MFKLSEFERTMDKGNKYIEKGEFIKAKEMYLRCFAMQPDDVAVLNNLSQLYCILGDIPTAKGYSENLLKECDNLLEENYIEELLILKSTALITLERYDDAIETVDEILKINPNNLIGLYHKSHHLEKNKNYEDALIYIERILKEDPNDIAALLSKGRNLVELNKFDEAEKCYNLVFEMDPENKAAMNLKAQLLKKKNILND